MTDNHKKFLSHLDNSTEAVFIAALYLHKKGLDVRINAMQRAKSHKDWKNCKDDGDLYVYKNKNKYRVEVKGRGTGFSCSEDWKYKDFMICAKHSYDLAEPKPYAYMILSKERTHVAIVKTSTKHKWNYKYKMDKRYENYGQEFYFCSKDNVEWRAL